MSPRKQKENKNGPVCKKIGRGQKQKKQSKLLGTHIRSGSDLRKQRKEKIIKTREPIGRFESRVLEGEDRHIT